MALGPVKAASIWPLIKAVVSYSISEGQDLETNSSFSLIYQFFYISTSNCISMYLETF